MDITLKNLNKEGEEQTLYTVNLFVNLIYDFHPLTLLTNFSKEQKCFMYRLK